MKKTQPHDHQGEKDDCEQSARPGRELQSRNDVVHAETLGTPSNDGDDLKLVAIVHLLSSPSAPWHDQAVVFNNDQGRVMAQGADDSLN